MARLNLRRGRTEPKASEAIADERTAAPAVEARPGSANGHVNGATATAAPEEAAPTPPPPPRRFRLPRTFDSFYDREFRWFYISMLGHMAAMNMQLVIRGLLAYELTGSYAALGLVGLAGAVPMLFLSVFGGVLADRLPKRTVMQAGQLASFLNAAALAALMFAGLMTLEWLLFSAVLQGITMALMMPSRQAMIPEVVSMDRMMNAISLNMAGMNSMRLFAPALGGFIVGAFGFEWAFSVMAGLYVLAVIAMSQVTWKPASAPGEIGQSAVAMGTSALADIGGGLAYIWRDRRMFVILSLAFITSIFGMPLQFLLPGYVSDIFADDAQEAANLAGLLLSISAIGALVGALFLATIPDKRRGWMFLAGAATLGLGIFMFAQADTWVLAAVFMMVVGLGSAFRMALSQGLLHSYVDNAYRGRVMSVFMTQMSAMQFATFFVGVVAEFFGVRVVIASLGVLLIGVTALYAVFVPSIRRMD